jgi:hypothetical protein
LNEGLAQTIDWFRKIDVSQWEPPTPNWAGGLPASAAQNRV